MKYMILTYGLLYRARRGGPLRDAGDDRMLSPWTQRDFRKGRSGPSQPGRCQSSGDGWRW